MQEGRKIEAKKVHHGGWIAQQKVVFVAAPRTRRWTGDGRHTWM